MYFLSLGYMNNGYATDQIAKQQPVNKNNLLFSFVTLDTKGFPPPYAFEYRYEYVCTFWKLQPRFFVLLCF